MERDPGPEPDSRFQALFEYSPVGVALSTLDGGFVEVNAAFRRAVPQAGPDGSCRRLEQLCRLVPRGAEVSAHARSVDTAAWRRTLRAVREGNADVAKVDLPLAVSGQEVCWVSMATVCIWLDGQPYLLTHLEDVTARHQEEQRLVNLALRDGLTGLANRTLLTDRMEAALARARRGKVAVGVLYLDLDGFKKVNDTLGHEAGDALLVATAKRISSVLRAGDTAARLGGDEFVVVAENVGTQEALTELTRRVERAITQPLEVGGRRVLVRASVGAVLSLPGESGDSVLRRADSSMFATKRVRRGSRRRTRLSVPSAGQLALLQDPVIAIPEVRHVPGGARSLDVGAASLDVGSASVDVGSTSLSVGSTSLSAEGPSLDVQTAESGPGTQPVAMVRTG